MALNATASVSSSLMPPRVTRIELSPSANRAVALSRRRTGRTILKTVASEMQTRSNTTPPLIQPTSTRLRWASGDFVVTECVSTAVAGGVVAALAISSDGIGETRGGLAAAAGGG